MKKNNKSKIVILGWGSLIQQPKKLQIEGTWDEDGPKLKIEFSRVSKNGRLTLVIDEENGIELSTLYIISACKTIDEAIKDLEKREDTNLSWIGYIDIKNNLCSYKINSNQIDVFDTIKQWAKSKEFDAIVWTALKSNFKNKTGKFFTVDNAIEYLKNLCGSIRDEAVKYFNQVPKQIKTPLRERFEKEFNL